MIYIEGGILDKVNRTFSGYVTVVPGDEDSGTAFRFARGDHEAGDREQRRAVERSCIGECSKELALAD